MLLSEVLVGAPPGAGAALTLGAVQQSQDELPRRVESVHRTTADGADVEPLHTPAAEDVLTLAHLDWIRPQTTAHGTLGILAEGSIWFEVLRHAPASAVRVRKQKKQSNTTADEREREI